MKIAEEALLESQALLSAVTEGIPDSILSKIAWAASLWPILPRSGVVGKNREEAIGKTIVSLERSGDWRGYHGKRSQDHGHSADGVVEEVGQTPDGYRTFLSTETPYRNSNG